jgi:hypothetical protein
MIDFFFFHVFKAFHDRQRSLRGKMRYLKNENNSLNEQFLTMTQLYKEIEQVIVVNLYLCHKWAIFFKWVVVQVWFFGMFKAILKHVLVQCAWHTKSFSAPSCPEVPHLLYFFEIIKFIKFWTSNRNDLRRRT